MRPSHATPGISAGSITERQLQKLGAIAPPAHLYVPHEQGLRDVNSVCKVADFHGKTKIEWGADGTQR